MNHQELPGQIGQDVFDWWMTKTWIPRSPVKSNGRNGDRHERAENLSEQAVRMGAVRRQPDDLYHAGMP